MFEDEQFDVVVSNLCLQLVSSPQNMVSESFRVLKKGGYAGFSVWGKKEYSKHFHATEEILKKNGIFFPPTRSNYKISENVDELKSLFEKNGFKKFKYEYLDSILKVLSFEDFQNHFHLLFQKLNEFDEEKRKRVTDELREYYETKINNSDGFVTLSNMIILVQKN